MALALVVDTLESVPEALRGAYVPDGAKFKLDAEVPDVGGLKSALEAERTARKQLDKDIAAWKKIGKTPDEIAELTAAAETAAQEAAKKAGNFDGILAQHKATWEKEKGTLVSERDNALGFGKSAIVETSVMGALTKAKVTPTGVALLTERLGRRVSLDISDGKRTVQIMQEDGKTPMIGSGADGSATFDDLVKEAVKNFPELFEGTGAGGGGTPPKGLGGSGGKTLTRAEWEKLSPTDQRSKHKEGWKIVD